MMLRFFMGRFFFQSLQLNATVDMGFHQPPARTRVFRHASHYKKLALN